MLLTYYLLETKAIQRTKKKNRQIVVFVGTQLGP